MLVKHNISQETKMFKSLWRSTGVTSDICDLQSNNNEVSFVFKDKHDIEQVFGSTIEITENSYGFIFMENKGTLPLGIKGLVSKTIIPGEKIIIKMNKKNNTYWVHLLSEYDYVGKLQKLKVSQLMVSDEPVDIYLPHKDNLPKDKQPLLPPEGEYKEISPS